MPTGLSNITFRVIYPYWCIIRFGDNQFGTKMITACAELTDIDQHFGPIGFGWVWLRSGWVGFWLSLIFILHKIKV